MWWHEALRPVRMQRVALLAPDNALRDLLVNVGDEGTVALDEIGTNDDVAPEPMPAAARLRRLDVSPIAPALSLVPPDLDRCERDGRLDLIAGEAQLEQRSAQAYTRESICAVTGWMPANDLPRLAHRVAGLGGAVVPMPRPPGVTPPTLLADHGAAREFAPLVETYGTVPYADVNPSVLAGLAYVVMFGMMFGDVGSGALLLLAAIAIRLPWWSRLAPLRRVWWFIAGAGLASMLFGVLYGEFFGPTGVIPVVWLAPLDEPITLLAAAIGVGAVLLAGAYALGSVNRFREGGWQAAIYAPSGIAGATLFVGLGVIIGGIWLALGWVVLLGGAIGVAGMTVAYIGLFAAAGGGGAGAMQAGIEVFDLVLRLGSNLVSFARLAAFGLTHAALGYVIWQATTASVEHGPLGVIGAIVIFLVGTAVAFALEALVAAIQALRLEYYELFSRVFDIEGQPFRPWHVPLTTTEASC